MLLARGVQPLARVADRVRAKVRRRRSSPRRRRGRRRRPRGRTATVSEHGRIDVVVSPRGSWPTAGSRTSPRRLRRRPRTNLHGRSTSPDTCSPSCAAGGRQLRARRLPHRAPRGARHGGVRGQQVGRARRWSVSCGSRTGTGPGCGSATSRPAGWTPRSTSRPRPTASPSGARRSPCRRPRRSRAGSWPSPTAGGAAARSGCQRRHPVRLHRPPVGLRRLVGPAVPVAAQDLTRARGRARQRAGAAARTQRAPRHHGNALVGIGRNLRGRRQGRP